MSGDNRSRTELLAEIADLRLRLADEYHYRAIVETMSEGAATLSPDGTVLYCNRRLAEMLRMPPEKVIGASLEDYVLPADFHIFSDLLENSSNKSSKGEIALTARGGKLLPVHLSCSPLDFGESREISMVVTDLSEQKRNEEIVASEKLARSILEQAGEAIIVCDEGGRVIRASRVAHKLCGENPKLRQFDQLFPLQLMGAKSLFSVSSPLKGEISLNAETILKRRDDSIRHLLLNATPLKSRQETVLGCVITLTDITRHKRAEKKLQESQRILDALMEHVPEGITIAYAPDVKIRMISKHGQQMIGRRSKEISGMPLAQHAEYWDILHVDGLAPATAEELPLTRAIRQGEVIDNEEWVLQRTSGEMITVLCNANPIKDKKGTILGGIVVWRDITARKQDEEALRQANELLEKRVAKRTEELALTVTTLQEEITDRIKAEDTILSLNRLYSVLSRTNQVIVRARNRNSLFRSVCKVVVEHGGLKMAWIGLVDDESGAVKPVAWNGVSESYFDDERISVREENEPPDITGAAIRGGSYSVCNDLSASTQTFQKKLQKKGFLSSAAIALKLNGRVLGALTIYAGEVEFFHSQIVELLQQMAMDISFALDSLDTEARRKEAERALRAETAERLRTMAELREKDHLLMQQSRQAAMGEMIGNIAHQWRQPLNTLGLVIQELPINYELGDFTKQYLDEAVGKAMQVIFHMSQTIDDFRYYFKPNKEKVRFDVRQIMAKTLSLIDGSFNNEGITIIFDGQEGISIYGSPNEFSQVLLNILTNARDALAERKPDKPTLRVSLFSEKEKTVVTIADNAGGIPDDIIGRIFDPYFTTKQQDKGTGVGLFMSKTIIEKYMHGALTVHNTNDGAEFRIEV